MYIVEMKFQIANNIHIQLPIYSMQGKLHILGRSLILRIALTIYAYPNFYFFQT